MESMPDRVSRVFREGLEALNESAIPYVVGGAFAVHHYSGVWRNTHDLDVYVERRHVPLAVEVLLRAGFHDYGEMGAGDREWIYHAVKDHVLMDVIWQPPNGLSPVDDAFYARGPEGTFVGVPVRFMPPDEVVYAKMFTLNRHRCDWPDVFNVLRASPQPLDWQHLLRKLDVHWPVLLAMTVLFDWMYPGDRSCIPDEVRSEILSRKVNLSPEPDQRTRESILDPWIYTRPIAA